MKINLSYILFLLLTAPGLQAQEILSPSQPPAKYITKFPFTQYSGGVMIVRATFENLKDSFNFILDTGSGGISLDSSTCAQNNIASFTSDTTITGIGGVKKVPFVFNKCLNMPGVKIEHLDFHVSDYDVLTSVYGEKIDGIIGYSFLKRYILKVNFDSLHIELYTPGEIDYPRNGTLLHPIFTALPIQNIQIKDNKKLNFNFYFDTGAGLCFLMSERLVKDSSILLKKRKPLVTQAEGLGGRLQMRLTVIKEVKIGPYRFRKVPTYLYQDDNNVTAYPYCGGLIGNELIRRFNLIINYPQREIHILPNTHYAESFDYAYTGLGIYYLDGKIMVESVINDSPAEKAGLKIDDEIYGVGNNLSHNIQQYKNILQAANQTIKIIVRRDGEVMQLFIKPKNIF